MILLSATDIVNADRFCTEFRHRKRSKSMTFLISYELNIRLISCQFTYDVENQQFGQKYTIKEVCRPSLHLVLPAFCNDLKKNNLFFCQRLIESISGNVNWFSSFKAKEPTRSKILNSYHFQVLPFLDKFHYKRHLFD